MAASAVTWGVFLDIAIRVLKPLLKLLSAEVRTLLTDLVTKFYAKAKTTDNPWDDFVAGLLMELLGIPVPEE